MKDNSKIIAIVLAIVTIIVVVLVNIFGGKDTKQKEKINIVTNYSDFYTVSSCLTRTFDYASKGDADSLLLVVEDKYKQKNKITEENVFDMFDNINSNITFVSKKMYYENINSNIVKYYVYGYTATNQLFDGTAVKNTKKDEMYFIVYIDKSSKVFSVEPYSGKIFEGDTNE